MQRSFLPRDGLLSAPAPADPGPACDEQGGLGFWLWRLAGCAGRGAPWVPSRSAGRWDCSQWPRAQCNGCLWLVTQHRTRPDGACAEKVLVWTCTRVPGEPRPEPHAGSAAPRERGQRPLSGLRRLTCLWATTGTLGVLGVLLLPLLSFPKLREKSGLQLFQEVGAGPPAAVLHNRPAPGSASLAAPAATNPGCCTTCVLPSPAPSQISRV